MIFLQFIKHKKNLAEFAFCINKNKRKRSDNNLKFLKNKTFIYIEIQYRSNFLKVPLHEDLFSKKLRIYNHIINTNLFTK